MVYDVQGKVVIITGAGSGFGERLAKRLASKGARLVLSDLNEAQGNRVKEEVTGKYGPRAIFVRANVADNDQVKNIFKRAKEHFGTFDVVVNNAGVPEISDFFTDEHDRWQSQIEVNLRPVILGTRLAITEFQKEKKKGVIVSTASLAGLYPQALSPVYGPVKAAVVHFCRSPTGIQQVGRVDQGPSEITNFLSKAGVGRDGRVSPMVDPEQVIDAFVHAIEGEAIRITPERGIEVQYLSRKPPLKLKDLSAPYKSVTSKL
ncbi:hypothetical protein HDU93_006004 [Gonapodya sp. JEL0774]|nr:hypothetical protein HDU93_006004 [Gonapodya sp. JEL0774]